MKKILPVLLIAVICVSFFLPSSASSEPTEYELKVPEKDWSFGLGCSPDGNWIYEWYARDTGTFDRMQWNAAEQKYAAPCKTAALDDPYYYCHTFRESSRIMVLHPGDGADAVLTFVCPEDGLISLSATIGRRNDRIENNGNTIRLMHNDTPLLLEGVEEFKLEKKYYTVEFSMHEVKAGDKIRIMIGSQGDRSLDSVRISEASVTYEPDWFYGRQYSVVCVGDGISAGLNGISGRKAYPGQLEEILQTKGGIDVLVHNFAVRDATVIGTELPAFRARDEYGQSKSSDPDVVILALGAFDSRKDFWDAEKYKETYRLIIAGYQNLDTDPVIYLAYTTYVADPTQTDCRREVIQDEILPIQYELAKEMGVKILDLNTLTQTDEERFTKGIYPTIGLHKDLAEYVYNVFCADSVIGLSPEKATAVVSAIDPAADAEVSAGTVTDSTSSDAPVDSADDGESSGALLWIIIGAAVLIAAVAVTLVLMKKKK